MLANKLEGLLFVLCKSKQIFTFTELSTFQDNPERLQILDRFSCSPVRVRNLLDNHQSLPFLQRTQLSDNKISTILHCLKYFNVNIKRFSINSSHCNISNNVIGGK